MAAWRSRRYPRASRDETADARRSTDRHRLDACKRSKWDRIVRRAGRSSLEQSWDDGEALRATAKVAIERAVVRADGEAVAMVQAVVRRIAGLGKLVRIVRGPLWPRGEPGPVDRQRVLDAVASTWRLSRRQRLVWMPELADTPESIEAMRACGKRHMVTGDTSSRVDLSRSVETLRRELDGKWRNMLCAAERDAVALTRTPGSGPEFDWLLERYAKLRRERRFLGPSPDLIRARAGGAPNAGVLFLRHGAPATYCVGWTGDDGRRTRAHNTILWQGMLALRDARVAWLDLGGIDASAPGVARFKLGVDGEVFTLAGTFI